MPRITEDLLRKRAEHNEGQLANLEEVTLHQFEIEKIENLDKLCRHLKILLLQNNIIEKIENVSKLKELEYLNLALNNISIIENLEGCESLKKLDLTANFIDLEDYEKSMKNLQAVPSLKELYMTGNPITDWKNYRNFTVAMIHNLEMLDGKEVTPSERILAIQNLEANTIDLYTKIELKKIEEERKIKEPSVKKDDGLEEYTKESRRKMYLEMAKEKEEEDRRKNPQKYEKKIETPMYKNDGEIRQCNEGKYDFLLREWDDAEFSFFDIKIPKYLDTSLIDVNLNPFWVSVRIKGKLTQIKLSEEIIVAESEIQRSQITGALQIKMKKIRPNYLLKTINEKKIGIKKNHDEMIIKKELNIKEENKSLKKTYDETTFDEVPDLE